MTKCIARYIAHVIPLARARTQSLDYLSKLYLTSGGTFYSPIVTVLMANWPMKTTKVRIVYSP